MDSGTSKTYLKYRFHSKMIQWNEQNSFVFRYAVDMQMYIGISRIKKKKSKYVPVSNRIV